MPGIGHFYSSWTLWRCWKVLRLIGLERHATDRVCNGKPSRLVAICVLWPRYMLSCCRRRQYIGRFSFFSSCDWPRVVHGLGWVVGRKWQLCEKQICTYQTYVTVLLRNCSASWKLTVWHITASSVLSEIYIRANRLFLFTSNDII